jgi:hypothetical protein
MKLRVTGLLAAALMLLPTLSSAADERPYTEGNVIEVTSVRTKPGMFDAYMKYISTTLKQISEEQKKAGIILEYNVYAVTPQKPGDPDLYLVTVYKNMAALDNLEERTEAIQRKVWASRDLANKATADRESLREILGVELMRELVLK